MGGRRREGEALRYERFGCPEQDTALSVLSACERGVGPLVDGEGVLGLRRPFQVAGVATVIMTLWPVDDGAARLWVHHLNEARRPGRPIDDAVRQAGRRMLDSRP